MAASPLATVGENMEVKAVAERWGSSVSAVHKLVKRNPRKLRFHWIGNKVYIPASDVLAWERDPANAKRSRRRDCSSDEKPSPMPIVNSSSNGVPIKIGDDIDLTIPPGEGVEISVREDDGKHIIMNPGESETPIPNLSTEQSTDKLSRANEWLKVRQAEEAARAGKRTA